LKVNSACSFLLYGYITMHGRQNINFFMCVETGNVFGVSVTRGRTRFRSITESQPLVQNFHV